MKKGKDLVTITCYGKKEQMHRDEAIAFYSEAVMCCEGSEQSRYATILAQLSAGEKECSDELY